MAGNTIEFNLRLNAEQFKQEAKTVKQQINDFLNPRSVATREAANRFLASPPSADLLSRLGVPTPPPLRPPVIPPGGGGVNWRLAGMGAFASLFSPWLGARALSSSGLFGGGGGGGGSMIFGKGGFEAFLEAFIIFRPVLRLLRFEFELLAQAVRRGSEVFVKAAGLGISPERFAHTNLALQAAGLPAGTAERLIASAQFMRGTKITPAALEGQVRLGAGRGILSREEMQAILNMSGEVAKAWERTADAARQAGAAAKPLRDLEMGFTLFKIQFQTYFEQLAAIGGNALRFWLRIGEEFLHLENIVMGSLINLLQKIGVMPAGGADFKKFGLGPGTLAGRPESGWEKMGLIISGGMGGTDYAKQTAQNTKRLVDLLQVNKAMNPSVPSAPSVYNHLG